MTVTGPPGADLTKESRYDAASASQHVAEAHRNEISVVFRGGALDDELGDSLCRAHYTGRANRLVGGDEHEVLAPCLERSIDDVERSKTLFVIASITFSSINGTCFVRSGVEDGVGLVQS